MHLLVRRWCHGECDSILTEEDAEICAEQKYVCQLCRPPDEPPPHHIVRQKEAAEKAKQEKVNQNRPPSPPASPDYMVSAPSLQKKKLIFGAITKIFAYPALNSY